jgi:hypothetical protein
MESSTPPETPGKTPGEVPPPRRRLERAPSERYRLSDEALREEHHGSLRRATLFALLPALIGAVVFTLLAGPLALDVALVIVAAGMGLAIGRATVMGAGGALSGPQRIGVAVLIFVLALLGAELATWQFALAEGGVLGPIDYIRDVFGFLVVLELLAGLVGAVIAAA